MSMWVEIAIGLPLGLVAANITLWVVMWPTARVLRSTGLTVWETQRTLWLRVETEILIALKRLERRLDS